MPTINIASTVEALYRATNVFNIVYTQCLRQADEFIVRPSLRTVHVVGLLKQADDSIVSLLVQYPDLSTLRVHNEAEDEINCRHNKMNMQLMQIKQGDEELRQSSSPPVPYTTYSWPNWEEFSAIVMGNSASAR